MTVTGFTSRWWTGFPHVNHIVLPEHRPQLLKKVNDKIVKQSNEPNPSHSASIDVLYRALMTRRVFIKHLVIPVGVLWKVMFRSSTPILINTHRIYFTNNRQFARPSESRMVSKIVFFPRLLFWRNHSNNEVGVCRFITRTSSNSSFFPRSARTVHHELAANTVFLESVGFWPFPILAVMKSYLGYITFTERSSLDDSEVRHLKGNLR